MQVRQIRTRAALAIGAIVCMLGFTCLSSPGAPSKATSAQIDQMNQEIGGGSGGFGIAPPDWPAMAKKIRTATDSVDRRHWISEFARHTVALPESLRVLRLAELKQLMREGR
jgi:hypothetical protein